MNLMIAILMSLSAQAQTGDMMKTVMTCVPTTLRPDVGMSVTVSTGGLAGLTQVRVRHFFLGRSSVETFIVQEQPVDTHKLGAPIVFEGNGIRLSANFTTAPLKDGGHIGHLVIDGQGSDELSCKLN
jgi:hypothetical protein